MERKYPQAIAYGFDEIYPSGITLKFLLDAKDQKLPHGWKIYPVSSSQVSNYKKVFFFFQHTVLLQLEFKLVDKFVSREVPEPPACVVNVYAEDRSDTEEIFHYPVPLVGVNKPEKTFIHLSLRINPIAGT